MGLNIFLNSATYIPLNEIYYLFEIVKKVSINEIRFWHNTSVEQE